MRSFKFLFLVLTCAMPAFLPLNAESQFSFDENPLVGKQAPDFTLKTTNGETLSLDKFRGQSPTIVYFWATWCPHCVEEFKILSKLQADFDKQGIRILLVNIGEGPEEIQRFLKKLGIGASAEVVLDEKSDIANEYGIVGVPTVFFVDRKGVIVTMEHGFPENFQEILNLNLSQTADSQAASRNPQL